MRRQLGVGLRNAYDNLISPKSVFSSSFLKSNSNPFHQRSSSEYSTLSRSHLWKICSPNGNGGVSGTMIQKGFFPSPLLARRLFSNALWKGRTNIPHTIRNKRFYSFNSLDRGRSTADQRKKVLKNVTKRLYATHIAKTKKRRWYENPTNLISLGFVSCGVVIPVYCWNSETVPYANRGHFVLASTSLENKIGEFILKRRLIQSDRNKGKIVESSRVEKIWKDIIGGLMRNKKIPTSELCNWEIFVVDEPNCVNAVALPGGKIVVYTGMLNYLESDAEIAAVIAHEVGHVVARHYAERRSAVVWALVVPLLVYKAVDLLPRLPRPLGVFVLKASLYYLMSYLVLLAWFWRFSTWHEREADYIGMLVSACAGYDPRVAPQVCLKLENHSPSGNVLQALFDPHPHGKKRAQLLSRPKVMEEALAIYAEALRHKYK